MSYDHALNAHITFNPNVTISAAIDALEPLMEYFGWTRDQIASQQPLGESDFVQIHADGEIIHLMVIYTSGDVTSKYSAALTKFADNLCSIAKAGYLELHDHDTADLANAIDKFWYGENAAVAEAKIADAWDSASRELKEAGVPASTLAFIEQYLKQGTDSASIVAARKSIHADDAGQFFDELETEFESLRDISDQFGSDTLRDLFYVHSAILSNSHVEHFKNDSQLLEVIEQLPSKEKWLLSIQQA